MFLYSMKVLWKWPADESNPYLVRDKIRGLQTHVNASDPPLAMKAISYFLDKRRKYKIILMRVMVYGHQKCKLHIRNIS